MTAKEWRGWNDHLDRGASWAEIAKILDDMEAAEARAEAAEKGIARLRDRLAEQARQDRDALDGLRAEKEAVEKRQAALVIAIRNYRWMMPGSVAELDSALSGVKEAT